MGAFLPSRVLTHKNNDITNTGSVGQRCWCECKISTRRIYWDEDSTRTAVHLVSTQVFSYVTGGVSCIIPGTGTWIRYVWKQCDLGSQILFVYVLVSNLLKVREAKLRIAPATSVTSTASFCHLRLAGKRKSEKKNGTYSYIRTKRTLPSTQLIPLVDQVLARESETRSYEMSSCLP